jgi:hypothetical protein
MLRFDTTIAVCALLLSAIAASASVYQTHVIAEENSAAVWPYISFTLSGGPEHVALTMQNNGLGPAIIRSNQIMLDGKPVDSWSTVFAQLSRKAGHIASKSSSISGEAVLRPGEEFPLFDVRGVHILRGLAQNEKRVHFTVCYCSLLENCWLKTAAPAAPPPRPVARCPAAPTAAVGF